MTASQADDQPQAARREACLVLRGGPQGNRRILGLSLAERAAKAARSAGIALVREGEALPPADRYLFADASLLVERGWLREVLALPPERLPAAGPGLTVLGPEAAGGEARISEAAPVPASQVDCIAVEDESFRRAAEKRLLGALVKDTDGFLATHINRRVSLFVSRYMARTAVTPNQMTVLTGLLGLAGAPFFLSPHAHWQAIGGILFLLHSVLDGCDGELARLKFQESRFGGVLDFWSDNLVHMAVFGCMAFGWSAAAGAAWPLIFGAGAVFGTLIAAGFVYWRTMRAPQESGPVYTSVAKAQKTMLSALLDSLSRRDFIYGVFALSLFGMAHWFVALAGVGTPVFVIALFVLAWRERSAP